MSDIVAEPLGGAVGAGAAGGHLRMVGRVPWSRLSAADQARVEALFASRRPVDANLRYRLTRQGAHGPETVEAPADAVPQALIESVAATLE